jgi:hypothetical protein
MTRKYIISTIMILILFKALSFGQEDTFHTDQRSSIQTFANDLTALSRALKQNPNITKNESPVKGLLNHLDFTTMVQPDEFVRAFSLQNAEELAIQAAAQSVQNYRPDKQLSPSSNTSGTTSLVSKAGASDLLSLALDAGALTQSINGSTATVSGNLDGMFRAVTGYSPLCVYPCPAIGGKDIQWIDHYLLQPINVSVVTALAQQSSTTAPAAGQASGTVPTPVSNVAIPTGAGKISNVIARYQVLNKYDPHSQQFIEKWKNASDQQNFVKALLTADNNILAVRDLVLQSATPLDRDAILEATKTSNKDLADYFNQYYEDQVQKLGPSVSTAVAKAVQDIAASQQLWEKVREEAAGTLFTFEYSYNHSLSQPETHDFKIIYGYAPGSVSGMLSLNGSVSIYQVLPTGAKYGRLHYGQVSAEYDRPFAVSGNPNLLNLSLAGYWQYQPNPSILNIPAGTVAPGTTIPIPNGTQEFVGTAGSLWVTQAKFTIREKSGINFPIAVKWSNKSDLLSGNKIGAQVGISYDFSSLSSLFGGSTGK